jgi:hypothetical protein
LKARIRRVAWAPGGGLEISRDRARSGPGVALGREGEPEDAGRPGAEVDDGGGLGDVEGAERDREGLAGLEGGGLDVDREDGRGALGGGPGEAPGDEQAGREAQVPEESGAGDHGEHPGQEVEGCGRWAQEAAVGRSRRQPVPRAARARRVEPATQVEGSGMADGGSKAGPRVVPETESPTAENSK